MDIKVRGGSRGRKGRPPPYLQKDLKLTVKFLKLKNIFEIDREF
jgi:hypothetical protein